MLYKNLTCLIDGMATVEKEANKKYEQMVELVKLKPNPMAERLANELEDTGAPSMWDNMS